MTHSQGLTHKKMITQPKSKNLWIGIAVTAGILIAMLYQFEWNGFGEPIKKPNTVNNDTAERITTHYQSAKTLWNWLELFSGLGISVVAFWDIDLGMESNLNLMHKTNLKEK